MLKTCTEHGSSQSLFNFPNSDITILILHTEKLKHWEIK